MPQYSLDQLEGFKKTQRLAYACAAELAHTLEPGVTEREAAARLESMLRERGVRSFFHRPFAWFGSRATFDAIRIPLDFFPGDRRLVAGEPAILDVAPVLDGFTADIGYAFIVGNAADACEPFARAQGVLRELRGHILREVRSGRSMRDIYRSVDEAVNDSGFDNCHQKYPFRVLAHQVDVVVAPEALREVSAFRFGTEGVRLLARAAQSAMSNGDDGASTPLWSDARRCDGPPAPGLWAVEPHIGRDGVGSKWEELLVITESDAYWLDDAVPHAA